MVFFPGCWLGNDRQNLKLDELVNASSLSLPYKSIPTKVQGISFPRYNIDKNETKN